MDGLKTRALALVALTTVAAGATAALTGSPAPSDDDGPQHIIQATLNAGHIPQTVDLCNATEGRATVGLVWIYQLQGGSVATHDTIVRVRVGQAPAAVAAYSADRHFHVDVDETETGTSTWTEERETLVVMWAEEDSGPCKTGTIRVDAQPEDNGNTAGSGTSLTFQVRYPAG